MRVRVRVRVRGLGEDDPANNWLQLHKPTVLFQIKKMLSEWRGGANAAWSLRIGDVVRTLGPRGTVGGAARPGAPAVGGKQRNLVWPLQEIINRAVTV